MGYASVHGHHQRACTCKSFSLLSFFFSCTCFPIARRHITFFPTCAGLPISYAVNPLINEAKQEKGRKKGDGKQDLAVLDLHTV